LYHHENNAYVARRSKQQQNEESLMSSVKSRVSAMMSISGKTAKEFLRQETVSKAASKKFFLPDERSSMISDDETDQILKRSFEYMVALMEFNLVNLKFQLKYYLVIGFKEELSKNFKNKMMHHADWATLVEPDEHLNERMADVENKTKGVVASLHEVERLNRKL
jgi:hypothetical protein